jgi:CRISPR/Cas system-associated exonuclease Cas4 (RecB family)
MEDIPEYVGDISIRYPKRDDDTLEVNHSLLAQCEIDSLRSEVKSLRAIVQQRLVAGATIHQNANDLIRANQRLESERDELIGVIKSLRKNAREEADRIESARLLVKQLVFQIEYPAYTVDEAVSKMFLMENAKKFINEMS